MRLSRHLVPICAFLLAALLCGLAARLAAKAVEESSVAAVEEALEGEGHDWASVIGDGLQVIIEGEAPSEAVRFRAKSVAGGIVDASRVIDNMQVEAADQITPPAFDVEILQGDSGVSLIGLIPAGMDREAFLSQIRRAAGAAEVTDLLDVADYPIPDGWRGALTYAVRALEMLDHSKISVAPGFVEVAAISEGAEEKAQLERSLRRNLPAGLRVDVEISAPRPVITPFAVRFVIDAEGTRFETCAADTEEARTRITAAARAAGQEGEVTCALGLGTPSREWGAAVADGIAALAELGGGAITFSDADVSLVALPGLAQSSFDNVVGELENRLPDIFSLSAELPEVVQGDQGPVQFTATLAEGGQVQLRGRVESDLMNDIAGDFARARFVGGEVRMATRVGEGLPSGWSNRVLAGIEALAGLGDGVVVVEPGSVSVRGRTGNPDGEAAITRLLIDKLGPAAEVDVAVEYDEALDPIAALPSPEECVQHITQVTSATKILFEPGSANLTAETGPVVDQIAEILRACPDLPLEIAGYTDSQGREEMNQRLSQQRADAVLAALRTRRVPVGAFDASGYGEADPIADNDTEAGREANRRIEFRLMEPEGPPAPPSSSEADPQGGDEAAPEGAADEGEAEPEGDDFPAAMEAPPEKRPELRPEGLADEGDDGDN
ncbi:OmpA family protein [Pseudoroseicyclus tamaricis]|uniref:OmpA family protein n=1 Tax=Pseudoroseicyclus tamaricis TaxID=2705421 RepID=A0A6B2JVF1_9RHOB|nr:OmpA family protein [Pseudoroseicyclus tamaricis]NDV02060.1 OmpA family protein [Pseudoroseicyclus tamaricis]